MKPISLLMAAAGLGAVLFVTPALAKDKSLYERIGGYDAIAAVTDDFLARLENDDKLGRFFVGISDDSVAKIRQHVVDLVCAKTGGPLPLYRPRHEDRAQGARHHQGRLGRHSCPVR